ncbi:SDR family NAD(P)-dependent oxidoreductase [Pedobacter panaciterrae]
MKSLNNKVVLITGAGSGIGKAIAELFAKEGAKLVLSDIRNINIEEVAKEIDSSGDTVSCFPADVSNEKDVESLVNYVLNTFQSLDVLINNAGVMDDFSPVDQVTNELWNKIIGVNLNGPFYMSRAVMKIFRSTGAGNIINIASIAGLAGGRAGLAYTVSKHGLIGLTRNIAYQFAEKGIRCNAIAPGGIATNIMHGVEVNPYGYDRMNAGTANMPPAALPAEIAEVALFLASDKSKFINGSVITADGGWTAY